jgi:uncharacterized repeat protein (TIGR01451 family)
MPEPRADSQRFEQVLRELLSQGLSVRFQAQGASMSPAIRDQEFVEVTPVIVSKLRKDDIVLSKSNFGLRLHRIVMADAAHDVFITRGDCGEQDDPVLRGVEILGLARAKEVRVGKTLVRARFQSVSGWALRCAARAQYLTGKVTSTILRKGAAKHAALFLPILAALVFSANALRAQVAVDTTTSGSAELAGGFGSTLTIAHTTSGANRLMIVGVSININNGSSTTVSGITWNGTALTFIGAHNDAGNTRRVEQWYLLSPATGSANVVVTFTLANFVTEGVAAGVTTFTGVDQTVPLGTFTAADGANAANSQEDVPSAVNGMILDTLAIGSNRTVTVSGPQVQVWNLTSGNDGSGTDVRAVGSTRTGAPSVPISETFSGNSNWSLGAISINPSGADIGVTTSVSAVALGQNSTYNITISNNGPSAANNVTLTDTFASTGLSLVSVTPSSGTTCTTSTTISCTLPTPFASGATATVAVKVATTAAGFYPNTATVTDSGTPPDPNTGNDTYVALAPVVSVVCGISSLSAGGTLTGVVNTYYPGAASVTAGAISIPLGTANGSGTIAAGTELLVIQMQDASISTSNTVAYGNGYTGTGFTAINNSGNYEYVTATGPISNGSVPILGAGTGGGLVFGYNAAAASATKGASTYQVVLVPEYSSATLSSGLTAEAWNGSTGGILALDVAGQLTLGTATVSVNGLGFRGAAGLQMSGGGGLNTDYVQVSPSTYTPTTTGSGSTGEAGWDASKGEGVAGTPMWVESNQTFLQTTTAIGYPSGTAGVDGSMARGAAANAGGGGTDADPQTASPNGNDENAGGGGGANGGAGGFGGDSWDTNLSVGGEGGSAFPATIDRITLGGGGGAGTRNNSDGDNQASSGSAGGGVVFIRAYNFSGTATVTASGTNSYNGTSNDAGGGGGAGGTIVMLAANGGESGLTLQANGGSGGNAWESEAYALTQRHGPGGGGGGGVVLVSGTPASISVAGGANGLTLNTPAVSYGSTSGTTGISAVNDAMSQVTGLQSAEVCTRLPDLAIAKSHGGGNFTRGTAATYTLQVADVDTIASAGLVTVNDTLPLGATPTSATGTGWTCSTSNQTVSCTRSDSVAGGASYPAITVNANVSQSAPATVTNAAVVSGGGDVSPLNDTGTDVATVISSADMAVTDSGSPNPVSAGGNITYTQVVTNNGPSAADNATLVAAIPANTTLVSLVAAAGWSCQTPAVGSTGNVVCNNVNLAATANGTFSLVVKVNTGVANGTVISGTVSVSSSDVDPNTSNNTATVNTVVGTSGPNLSVTNVASPNPVQGGNNITYTQVLTNTGSLTATNGSFSEATPANTTFVSITPPAGWSCTGFPTNPCTDASVAAGTSGTFTVIYTVNSGTASGTTISDTATVTASNQSFGTNSATATDVVATSTQADVALSTAATPIVIAGNTITYTQTVTNNGPAAAAGVSLTEATPTNTTFQSVSAPVGWTCTTPAVGLTGNVVCSDPSNLSSGNSADIDIVLNVPSSVTASSITAASSVTSTTSDPNTTNNSTSVTTTVNVACDLSVTDSGSPNPVTAGATLTYTQVVTNAGPSNCSTATFNETTPMNTTFASIAATTGWTCTNFPTQCTNASVAPGSGTFTLKYTVSGSATAGTIIADTVSVATTSHDTNLNNNTATSNIGVTSASEADLSATNSANPSPVTAGSNITYTQSVTNAGPASANAPVFTETLPANTTAVSLTGPSGWTCVLGTLTCTDTAAMTAGTANFTFVVTVNNTVAAGTVITQTDSVTSTTQDPNSGNNSASATTYVADSADLSVTNTPNPVPVQAGNNITYTQVVSNAGPSTATSVTLTEALPANTTSVSLAGPAGWACTLATLTCSDPTLAPSSPATITYVVTVNSGTAAGTAIKETASVTSAVSDPNTSNNTATASDVVATSSQADLVTTNVASPTSLAAGSRVTYTQTVTNNGPASATAASFTETTPPNTTFQSITIPSGWTCPTLPAVGGTGSITCNDGSSLGTGAANAAAFTLVLQVNAGTPSGTSITDTATATATNIVPSLTTNTASATVVVANANSADMAIVKTATPNPVTEGTPLTYTLTVTNNGPASATTVSVTDTLPSILTYLSSTTTQGSCSEAGGTVTCLLGTMADAASATVTILTLPNAAGVISNTATVTADQVDPNLTNNSSTQTETVTYPTKIGLISFSAHSGKDKNGATRVLLTWTTGGEAHNLGFNVYRELNGTRVRMNSSMIAGSALLMTGALPRHSGRSYAWVDATTDSATDATTDPTAGVAAASYWLEDIDVNGQRTLHGPISAISAAAASGVASAEATAAETYMVSQLNKAQPASGAENSHIVESVADTVNPTPGQIKKQFDLAAHPAVKIYVRHEGWYRVSQSELVKAGLNANVDPASLHLYAEANDQPIQIIGAEPGPGGFGPQAAIAFYGTGIDTPYSGTRVYWLVSEANPGARISQLPASIGSNLPPPSYSTTVELQQHTTYFAALLTWNGENFFGALVSPTPVDQVLELPHLDKTSTQSPRLEVALQGIVTGYPHDVAVTVNGTAVGDVVFSGQGIGNLTVNLPPGVLQPGSNTVTFTAQNGEYDTSLVDFVRITYPRRYIADSGYLKFTGRAGDEVVADGFNTSPVVLDITDPANPVELTPQVTAANGKYEVAVQVPFTTTNPAQPQRHTLLAVAQDRIASAAGVWPNHPSHWHSAQPGADIAMVTYGEFASALQPLVTAHANEGKSSAVVPVIDLYDEFNFGERTPFAIKQFLQSATQNWKTPPSFLLLSGRASLDPRNYLGFGNLDLVPTRIVQTTSLMTASDDWFSDFNNTGMPTIATGRLPVSTLTEAATVIDKIATYEAQSTNGPWTSNALMVADNSDTENFTQDSQTVQARLPSNMQVTDVFVSMVGTTAARGDIITAINSGQALVNYLGHGSEEQWSGSDIFDENTVGTLTNGSELPVFLIMDCLNGFFQDVYAQPLGVTLMLASNGGAVGVLASSGLNQAPPQTDLDALVVRNAVGVKGNTMGEAIVKAKSYIADPDVRRTFNLFGDPAMTMKRATGQ